MTWLFDSCKMIFDERTLIFVRAFSATYTCRFTFYWMRQQSFQNLNWKRQSQQKKSNFAQFLFISSRGSSVSSDDFSSLASPDSVNDNTKPNRVKLRKRSKNIKVENMEGILESSGSKGSGRGKSQILLKRRYSVPEIIMRKWVNHFDKNLFLRRNCKFSPNWWRRFP